MIRILLAGFMALLVVGCRSGTLVVESEHREPVRSSYDDRYWDGHVWIMSSNPSRGHYYHHGYWHLYPETHVYTEPRYAHFSVTVQPARVEERERHEDRYWDGHIWVMSSDPGRGHFFHHGYWHLYPETHVYREPRYAHFGVTIQPARDEKREHHDNNRRDR